MSKNYKEIAYSYFKYIFLAKKRLKNNEDCFLPAVAVMQSLPFVICTYVCTLYYDDMK